MNQTYQLKYFIILLSLIFGLGCVCSFYTNATVISVIDGDTITIKYLSKKKNKIQKIRLADIDAPELTQPFGKESKAYLEKLLLGKKVQLQIKGQDSYNRTIATVLYNNRVINQELVYEGIAWWYQAFSSNSDFKELQQGARSNKRGLWASNNTTPPWEFRHSKNTVPNTF